MSRHQTIRDDNAYEYIDHISVILDKISFGLFIWNLTSIRVYTSLDKRAMTCSSNFATIQFFHVTRSFHQLFYSKLFHVWFSVRIFWILAFCSLMRMRHALKRPIISHNSMGVTRLKYKTACNCDCNPNLDWFVSHRRFRRSWDCGKGTRL